MAAVALYLCTTKGLATLVAALESNVEIGYVVAAPAGGMDDDSHVEIAAECKRAGVRVYLWAAPEIHPVDVVIAAGWRRLLDVDVPLVVLHDSLLPRYRGFAPLITALVNGEPEVGVTAFMARPVPDTGPIVAQRALPVVYPARVGDVIAGLCPLYAALTAEICATLAAGDTLRYAEQEHEHATYSVWRDADDYRIDWARDDRRICRLVDAASSPFPGAWTTVAGKPVRIDRAHPVPDVRIEDRQPGKVLRVEDGMPVVVCGRGLVRIDAYRGEGPPVKLKVRYA